MPRRHQIDVYRIGFVNGTQCYHEHVSAAHGRSTAFSVTNPLRKSKFAHLPSVADIMPATNRAAGYNQLRLPNPSNEILNVRRLHSVLGHLLCEELRQQMPHYSFPGSVPAVVHHQQEHWKYA